MLELNSQHRSVYHEPSLWSPRSARIPSNEIYKQIRDALLDSKTIIRDGVYYQADSPTWRDHNQQRRFGKSFGYKLGPGLEGVRHQQVTLTNKPLLRSINRVNKLRQSEIVTLPHRHIWHCLQDITIDHQAAQQALDSMITSASPEEITAMSPA
jgi:hypothetical protein